MKEHIEKTLLEIVSEYDVTSVSLERPAHMEHGDYACSIALSLSKKLKKNPLEIAETIVDAFRAKNIPQVKTVAVAPPGFINFTLDESYYVNLLATILEQKNNFGKTDGRAGKTVMVEYTDPNPFKVFHIGHLMSNAIGESISRIIEWDGARVLRANYQGDVGPHVAKAIWGMRKHRTAFPQDTDPLSVKMRFIGDAYAYGSAQYEADINAKKEIDEINREVYTRENDDINVYYNKGRAWSLEHFEEIYALLGTKFDHYFFESEVAATGLSLVKEYTPAVFTESDGAIVFNGEEKGLHTRVFINSKGLPTYEAKELGLAMRKSEEHALDESIVITANEQQEYFKVVLSALGEMNPEVSKKISHVTHGMMQGADGSKLSSRKGTALTGESLISDVRGLVLNKITDRDVPEEEKATIADMVAVGAVKYSILRSKTKSNIAFDFEKSISFEGDSGPYLSYTLTRARSLMKKAHDEGIMPSPVYSEEGNEVVRLLDRFIEVCTRSAHELEPHHIANYAIELASAFNAFYATSPIVGSEKAGERLALVVATESVLGSALTLLGIKTPERM